MLGLGYVSIILFLLYGIKIVFFQANTFKLNERDRLKLINVARKIKVIDAFMLRRAGHIIKITKQSKVIPVSSYMKNKHWHTWIQWWLSMEKILKFDEYPGKRFKLMYVYFTKIVISLQKLPLSINKNYLYYFNFFNIRKMILLVHCKQTIINYLVKTTYLLIKIYKFRNSTFQNYTFLS